MPYECPLLSCGRQVLYGRPLLLCGHRVLYDRRLPLVPSPLIVGSILVEVIGMLRSGATDLRFCVAVYCDGKKISSGDPNKSRSNATLE